MLARWTGGELLRLQCYEGLDVSQAVYEWDYSRQLLHLRAAEAAGAATAPRSSQLEDELYDERFLVRRPLLQAVDRRRRSAAGAAHRRGRPGRRRVRGVPARGPVRLHGHRARARARSTPTTPPVVVITSNRTRDVHDALKRRCLYHWVEHPDFEREVAIVQRPGARASASGWPARSRPPPRRCAAPGSTSRPASPRPSTGPRRSRVLGATELDAEHGRRHAGHGAEVPRGPGAGPGRRPRRVWCAAAIAAQRRERRRPLRPGSAGRRSRFVRTPAPGRTRRAGRRHRSTSSRRSTCSTSADADDVYWAGRATLVHRPEDVARLRPRLRRLLRRRADRASTASRRAGARHAWRSTTPTPTTRRRRRRDPTTTPTDPGPVLAGRDAAPARTSPRCDDDELAEASALDGPTCASSARRGRRAGRAPRVADAAAPTCAARSATRSRTGGEPIRRRPPRPGRAAPPGGAAARRVAARWSPTPGRCCASSTPRSSARAGSRRSPLGTRLTRMTRELSTPRPRRRAGPGRRGGRGLLRRHPPRRGPAGVQRRVGRAGHGPGRGRGDPLRRLGPGRPRPARRADGPAAAGSPTGWCG